MSGGKNTNKNGLAFENLTDLKEALTIVEKQKYADKIEYNGKQIFTCKKTKFYKFMADKCDHTIKKAHGCKQPDESYIDEDKKIIFILEKKFQKSGGSVCEKIQTTKFKIWQYDRTFPDYKIVYIYCLSAWFKTNCPAEIEYLNLNKVPIFWGFEKNYKEKLIDYIFNYEL